MARRRWESGLRVKQWFGLILAVIIMSPLLWQSAPAKAAVGVNPQLNFQARLLNSSGVPMPDGIYNAQFKIYKNGPGLVGDVTQTLLWTENYQNLATQGITLTNGYFSIQLGSITPFGAAVDWNNDTLWLSVNFGNTNATCNPIGSCALDGEMSPFKRLSSSPYAFNSSQLGGLTSAQFLQIGQGMQTDASTADGLALNKTGAGNLIRLQSNGSDAFTLSSSGDLTFGANANHVLTVATAGAGVVGLNLSLTAGAAGTGGSTLTGGSLTLQGGTGGGTNGNGGNLVLGGGAANGTGSTGIVSVVSATTVQAAVASPNLFRVNDTTGASILNVNATTKRVGIATTVPGYPLDVTGDINTSTGLRVAGTFVCTTSGCTPAAGSANYIQNGVASQVANFNIQSAAATSVGSTIRGAAGQTADLLQLQNPAGTTVLAKIDANGNLTNGTITSGLINGQTISSTASFTGTVNAVTGYQVAGTATTGNYLRGNGTNFISSAIQASDLPAGSGNYIQNGTVVQSGNYNIQSVNSSSIAAILQGAVGQARDLQEFRDSNGNVLSAFDQNGQLALGRRAISGTMQAGLLTFSGGTTNGYGVTLQTVAALTANQTIMLPNESGTACLQTSINCGFLTGSAANGYYVQLQNTTPGTAQVGSFNLNGSGILGGTLSVGTAASTATLQVRGTALIQSATNSATAFQIKSAGGTTLFNADTSSMQAELTGKLLVGAVAGGGGTTSIYDQQFDSGSPLWTNAGTTRGTYTWRSSTNAPAYTGSTYWAYGSGATDGYDTGGAINSLSYSPSITLTGATDQLSLWYQLGLQEVGTAYDSAYIEIVDGNTPTTVLSSTQLTTNQAAWTHYTQTVDPAWRNIRVQIRIYTADGINNAGIGLRVDSVNVTSTASGSPVPQYALDVQDNQISSYVARIQNTSNSSTSGGLLVDLGLTNASRSASNYFIGFSGNGIVAGKIQGGANAVAYTTTGADYAEYFKADPKNLPPPGSLVSISGAQTVGPATNNGAQLAGVISTSPGFVGNGPICNVNDKICDSDYAKYNVLVALNGQVPTKVSIGNGVIQAGDPVGPSATPGVAQKVTAGAIIGYALGAATADGTVNVLIRPGAYNPIGGTGMQGGGDVNVANLMVSGLATMANLNVSGQTTLNNLTVTGKATFGGDLTVAGTVMVENIVINGLIMTQGVTPIATALPALGENARVTIVGNATSGTISFTSGIADSQNHFSLSSGQLVDIKFNAPLSSLPRLVLTPANARAADLKYYYDANTSDFWISSSTAPLANTTYTYSYILVQ